MTFFHERILILVIVFFTVTLSFFRPTFSEDASQPSFIDEWETVLDERVIEKLRNPNVALPEILFTGIDDLKLFQTNVGDVQIDLKVHRRVFDNRNIENTWTVVDKFNVSGSIPLYTTALNSLGSALGSATYVGFSVGSQFGIEFINIRQVDSKNYVALPSVSQRKKEIESTRWYNDFVKNPPPPTPNDEDPDKKGGQWIYRENENGNPFFSFLYNENSVFAPFSSFWNLVMFPFRLPLRADHILWMERGEIISYVGHGSIEVGASVGWNPDVTGLSNTGTHISYSTFVNGAYRISVLNEDHQFVRVKASRIGTIGHGASIGANSKPTVLDGIIIIKNLAGQLKVTPFNFSVGQALSRSFDVGYRYDLKNPTGREAYENAVIGRFSLSDTLAIDAQGNPKDFNATGVQKLFTRETQSDGTGLQTRMKIGFIFSRASSSTFGNVNTVITFPDGSRRFFTSLVENSEEWNTFWGAYEKMIYRFTVNVDLDQYETTPAALQAVTFSAEGDIKDSVTYKTEMMSYILEVENSVGKFGIIPRPPDNMEGRAFRTSMIEDFRLFPSGSLGRSHLYYKLNLDQALIRKIIETPNEAMWGIIEEAFGAPSGYWNNPLTRFLYQLLHLPFTIIQAPLYLENLNLRAGSDLIHARLIHHRWKELKNIRNVQRLAQAFAKMFFDNFYSYELVRILRARLNKDAVGYIISGESPYFGRIYDQGNIPLNRDDIATKLQREIDFEQEGPHPPEWGEQFVEIGLKVDRIDGNRYRMTINLSSLVKAMFFELDLKNPWWFFNNGKIAELLIYNTGEFLVGKNVFILNPHHDPGNPNHLWFKLAQHIKSGNRYKIRASANKNGIHWGPVAEVYFSAR